MIKTLEKPEQNSINSIATIYVKINSNIKSITSQIEKTFENSNLILIVHHYVSLETVNGERKNLFNLKVRFRDNLSVAEFDKALKLLGYVLNIFQSNIVYAHVEKKLFEHLYFFQNNANSEIEKQTNNKQEDKISYSFQTNQEVKYRKKIHIFGYYSKIPGMAVIHRKNKHDKQESIVVSTNRIKGVT